MPVGVVAGLTVRPLVVLVAVSSTIVRMSVSERSRQLIEVELSRRCSILSTTPTCKGGIPGGSTLGSPISMQLTAYGRKIAGPSATTASFIRELRKVKSWNDVGVLPSPGGFTGFGTSGMPASPS